MLPRAAPMPPCAATVWERVGNTFESTATRRPAWASSSAPRMPAPPAPTITASNLRMGALISSSPEDRRGPDEIEDEREAHRRLRREAHARRVQVIHEDVAHSDPCVVEERRDEEHRREAHRGAREHGLPIVIGMRRIDDEA